MQLSTTSLNGVPSGSVSNEVLSSAKLWVELKPTPKRSLVDPIIPLTGALVGLVHAASRENPSAS